MVTVDWAEAARVAGVGFGTVFIVLIVLWLVALGGGKICQRWWKEEEPEPKKRDDSQA